MKWIFVLVFLLLVPGAYAHLDGGTDKVVDGYLVYFGFSPEQPSSADRVLFAFNLLDNATKEVIMPESVWIRISGAETVFAGTFHPEAGNVAFSYMFPYAGEYGITARFKDGENTLVEADFNITVAGDSGLIYYAIALIAIAIGAITIKVRKS